MAAYSIWQYRREEYGNIAAALGGVYADVHAQVMATEPADAEDNLPEMVKARKLGVFDAVMRGDVAYDDLLDDAYGAAA